MQRLRESLGVSAHDARRIESDLGLRAELAAGTALGLNDDAAEPDGVRV